VPTSAGGGNDTMARILTRKLGPGLGHVVSVENRTGANGSVAAEYVAASRPDGHTLMFGYIATHGINPVLQTLRYDPIKDFAPVGLVGYSPTVLVVNTELPVRDVLSFIRLLQSSPAGRLHYAAAGEGTIPHLAAEMFLRTLGVQGQQGFQHAGAAPAISATVRGQSHWMFPSLFSALPYLKSGKLRPLAVASATRLSAWPGVPTLAEAGIPDLDLTQWYALFAPAGTPVPIVRKLNQVLNQVLEDPEVRARMEQDGAQVQTSTPEQLLRHVRTELDRWQGLVRATGLLQAQALELAQEL
jgi:tripartite-type tricarboxylate transporter receptor subunit TctC